MPTARTLVLAAIVLAAGSVAGVEATSDRTYLALRGARPDGRRIDAAQLVIQKDAYRLTFERGTLHLLAPVEGRTIGAVFLGKGAYELTPASENERRHLALLSGDEKLERWSDSFDRLLLLFADDTFDVLALDHPVIAGAPDSAAVSAFDDLFASQRDLDHFATNFHLRVLQDLLNSPNNRNTVFMAVVDGARLSPALLAVDPLGADALGLSDDLGGEDVALYSGDTSRRGFWYLSHRKWELDRNRPSPFVRLADARHYRIEARVVHNTEIEAETTITFATQTPTLRVLPLALMRKLRISTVDWTPGDGRIDASWKPAAWVQEGQNEDSDAAVVFPEALAKGQLATVRIRYGGKEVLYDIGEKNFVVTSRTTWYPNLGTFSDVATYELLFHLPERSDVVATGALVEQRDEPGGVLSVWKSDVPLRVAGFNYGRFKKKERKDEQAGLTLQVYTSSGTPGYLRELQAYLDDSGLGGESGALPQDLDDPSGFSSGVYMAPNVANINTSTLAEAALVDATNGGRAFRAYFGPTSFDRLAITQQAEWTYGQSWPTLVFLPYWSFIHAGLRQQLGLQSIRAADAEALSFHEISHQWWGHEVGWASYRDQWLSEGFAQFSALLAVQLSRGWRAADRMLELERRDLFEGVAGNGVANDNGPISLGFRNESFRSQGTYQRVIYGKGMYVLHMLRMMMHTPGPEPDAAFIAMMSDFVRTWSGKNPSTADFEKMVEKHIVPAMNATGDGKMDWFFRQWVYGTEVPRLTADLQVTPQGDGFHITGTIVQSGVGADFRTLVPIYVELEGKRGGTARIASVPLIGSATRQVDFHAKFPAPPKRALINAHYDVLTRD
jgi:hypothetical protein